MSLRPVDKEKPPSTLWRRFGHYLRKHLIGLAVVTAVSAIIVFVGPVRSLAPDWLVLIATMGLFFWPLGLVSGVFSSLMTAIDHKPDEAAALTPEERRRERDRRTINFLIAAAITAALSFFIWRFQNDDLTRWILILWTFFVVSWLVDFVTTFRAKRSKPKTLTEEFEERARRRREARSKSSGS